jgi:TRAP-type mannitol/chloroaromatic compound transport system substrate-binding protein
MNRRMFLTNASRSAMVTGVGLLGAPAVHATTRYAWTMVTAWPKDFPGVGTGANNLAQHIARMSDQRLTITVYGAGELVPAFDIFDAVAAGKAEMGHASALYWKAKHPAMPFFATVPFGLTAQEMEAWLRYGGGEALWDALYTGFNLKPFAAGNTGVQMGGWFNKVINTVEDFKGLKMRFPGLGGDVLARLGAQIVDLPGSDILPALQSGAIEAAEWVGPYNDLAFGLHTVAQYYYWPGWHEPGAVLECMIHKPVYEALPADLQAIITQAMQAAYSDMLAEYTAGNNTALMTLVQTHKVQLRRFPNAVLGRLGKISQEVVAALAATDPMAQKVYQSFHAFRKHAIEWGQIGEEAYSLARSLTSTF